jgi:hypothetical protein
MPEFATFRGALCISVLELRRATIMFDASAQMGNERLRLFRRQTP